MYNSYPPVEKSIERKRQQEHDARETEHLEIDRRRDKREQRLYWLAVISVGVSVASLFTAGISVYVAVTALRISCLQ